MKLRTALPICFGVTVLALSSCQKPKQHLMKKWQVVSMEDVHGDSLRTAFLKSIDTMTVYDTAFAMALDVHDLESFKALMREDVENEMSNMKDGAKLMNMDFQKEGRLLISRGGEVDTARWELSDKTLYMTWKKPDGDDYKDSSTVDKLNADNLRLKVEQGGRTVFLNLKPYTKEDSAAARTILDRVEQERAAFERESAAH